MVGMAFCKSTDDIFGKRIMFKEGKSIFTVSVYLSKKRCCPFYDRSSPKIINLPQIAGWSPWGIVPY